MPTFAQNPSPEYEAVRRKILVDSGRDPDKFDIDLDTGKFVENPGSLKSFGASAAYNAPDALIGGASMGLANKVLSAIPTTTPIGGIAKAIGTFAAPFVGEYLANKAGLQEGKRNVMPEGVTSTYDVGSQMNPTATQLGGVASGIVGGMRPSISNIKGAVNAGRSTIAGLPWEQIPAGQRGALVNVGLGTALGGGIPAAQQAWNSGEITDPKSIAIGAAGGALFNEPNRIGRAFGFHPTPADTGQIVPPIGARGGDLAPTPDAQMPPAYRQMMQELGQNQDVTMRFDPSVVAKRPPIEEVKGEFTPSSDPLVSSLAQVSEKLGTHDTPPHELLHPILYEMRNGSPAEQNLLRRAMESIGGRFEDVGTPAGEAFEEKLVEGASEEFSKRMTGEGSESVLSDLGSFVRDRFLRRGTPADYSRILANILQRQGAKFERTGIQAQSAPENKPTTPPPQPSGPRIRVVGQTGVESPTFDTGNREHGDEIFEGGYKPPVPPEPPIEHAPWETQGGDYESETEVRPLGPPIADAPPATPPTNPEKAVTPSVGETPPIRRRFGLANATEAGRESMPQQVPESVVEGRGVPAENEVTAYGNESRYSRFGPKKQQTDEIPRRGLNPLEGEVNKLARGGASHTALASGLHEAYDIRRELTGRYTNPLINSFEKLSPPNREKLYATLIDEDRSGNVLRTQLRDPELIRAYDEVRQVIRQMALDQITAGQPVWRKTGPSQRGVNPTYFPNVISAGIRRVLAEGQSTKAFQQLRTEFIAHQRANGLSQIRAEENFEDLLGSFHNNPASNPAKFGGVRMPEGVGLPDSWIEADPIKAVRHYTTKFIRDRAFWDAVETKSDLMSYLGSDTYRGNVKVPNTGTPQPNLIRDPQVQNILRDFFGTAQVGTEPIFKGASRLATGALVGPMSKIADVSTVPFKALAYAPTAPDAISAVVKGFADWQGGYERAFETGLNRRGGLVVAQDLLGFGEQVNQRMMGLTEALTKYTGAEGLELISRGLSQSIGEYIGDTWLALAKTRDPKALEFLAKLGANTNTPRAELGTRIAQLLQGRYDAVNLPAMALTGPISPFFALQRWSVEQFNNFQRFAVDPLIKHGDPGPAIAQILGGLAGGLAINELREKISGKKSQTASWAELQAGKDAPGFKDAVTYKLLSAAQVTGTVGILSELAKQSYEAATKRNVQGLNYPLISVLSDAVNRTLAAGEAIASGQDANEVIKQATLDIAKNNVQAFRIARQIAAQTGIAPDAAKELVKSNETRDQDTWSRMTGRALGTPARTSPSYERLNEKEFDEAPINEAAKMVPSMVKLAWTQSHGDPSQFSQRLRQLRGIKVEGMPNPDRDPLAAMNYYKWLKTTQGQDAANLRWNDYQRRNVEAKVKRELIPTMAVR